MIIIEVENAQEFGHHSQQILAASEQQGRTQPQEEYVRGWLFSFKFVGKEEELS